VGAGAPHGAFSAYCLDAGAAEATAFDRGALVGTVGPGETAADGEGVHGAYSANVLATGAAEASAGAPRGAGVGALATTAGGVAAATRGALRSASVEAGAPEARSMT
jgi:hypothetical protein